MYHVHSLGYRSHNWAWNYTDARAQLRAAAFGLTEPVPGGESDHAVLMALRGGEAARVGDPAAKQYNCAIGVSLNITGAGTFTDAGGTRGRFVQRSIIDADFHRRQLQRATREIRHAL